MPFLRTPRRNVPSSLSSRCSVSCSSTFKALELSMVSALPQVPIRFGFYLQFRTRPTPRPRGRGKKEVRSNRAGPALVVDAEALLRVFRHVRHAQGAPHERDPRLLGDRLQQREIPELPLAHLDLGHLVLEHPIAQRRQPGLLVSFG